MKNLLGAAVIAAVCAASAAHGQTIEWKVSDRFRLWDQARVGPQVVSLEQVLDRVSQATEPKAVENAMLEFLATQNDLYQKAYWRNDLESYDREYIWPANYRVQVRAIGLQGICRWTTSAGTLSKADTPCADPVEIIIDAAADGSGSEPMEVGVSSEAGSATHTIQVRDRLIASIGDSFAAGEGNPDVTMDARRLPRRFATEAVDSKGKGRAGWEAQRFVQWKPDWQDRWLGRAAVVGFAGGADWWDPRCHRSFHSQHMVAALRYAAARPHEATTFITYACSGAKTFEGLLVRQSKPPGFNDRRRHKKLTYAQVEVMVANLCEPRLGRSARHKERRRWEAYGKPVYENTWHCVKDAKSRSVDALMVTDGGNDIGFAPVIQDAMLPTADEIAPKGHTALKLLRRHLETRTPQDAGGDIKDWLPGHYDQLRDRLAEILPSGTPILQSAYPSPLNGDGGVCGGDVASRRLAAMNGFWPDRDVNPDDRWEMKIDIDEAKNANDQVFVPLNKAVERHVSKGASKGWRLVNAFSETFAKRGWCATAPGEAPEALPNWSPAQRQWVTQQTKGAEEIPWSPTAWSPYASRARLFRTPNDAAMTQQPASPRRLLGVFAPVANSYVGQQQESLLSAMSGSFHPTFEAHAIMGWSVAEALLNALPAEP